MLCFDKTCYTCLKSNNKQLVGLLKLDNDSVTYMDKLMLCVSPVLVQMQDRKMELCISCIKKLRISYQFKKMVMESQVTLQKYSEVNNSDIEDKLNLDSLSSDLFNSHIKSDCDNSIDSRMNDRHFKEDDTESDSDSKCNDGTDFSVEDIETEITKLCTTNKVKNRDKSNKDITNISASLQCDNQSEKKVDISSTKTEPFDSASDSVRTDNAEMESKGRPKKYNVKPKPVLNYFCEMCGSDFDKRWKLQKHKTRVHVDDKKHMCSFCNKNFKTAYHLREHVTSHTGERKYMCNYCEKSFQRLSSLKRHIYSHEAAPGQKTKKTPFLCNICGKNFPYSNGVQRHMRIHFGIKNHVCAICNRRFTQSTHLHVHMRTHTGEKPFICDTCGDAFSLNAGLQRHMNVHKKTALKSCEIDPVDIYLIKNERDF